MIENLPIERILSLSSNEKEIFCNKCGKINDQDNTQNFQNKNCCSNCKYSIIHEIDNMKNIKLFKELNLDKWKNVYLKCKYHMYGCNEIKLLSEVNEHEKECKFAIKGMNSNAVDESSLIPINSKLEEHAHYSSEEENDEKGISQSIRKTKFSEEISDKSSLNNQDSKEEGDNFELVETTSNHTKNVDKYLLNNVQNFDFVKPHEESKEILEIEEEKDHKYNEENNVKGNSYTSKNEIQIIVKQNQNIGDCKENSSEMSEIEKQFDMFNNHNESQNNPVSTLQFQSYEIMLFQLYELIKLEYTEFIQNKIKELEKNRQINSNFYSKNVIPKEGETINLKSNPSSSITNLNDLENKIRQIIQNELLQLKLLKSNEGDLSVKENANALNNSLDSRLTHLEKQQTGNWELIKKLMQKNEYIEKSIEHYNEAIQNYIEKAKFEKANFGKTFQTLKEKLANNTKKMKLDKLNKMHNYEKLSNFEKENFNDIISYLSIQIESLVEFLENKVAQEIDSIGININNKNQKEYNFNNSLTEIQIIEKIKTKNLNENNININYSENKNEIVKMDIQEMKKTISLIKSEISKSREKIDEIEDTLSNSSNYLIEKIVSKNFYDLEKNEVINLNPNVMNMNNFEKGDVINKNIMSRLNQLLNGYLIGTENLLDKRLVWDLDNLEKEVVNIKIDYLNFCNCCFCMIKSEKNISCKECNKIFCPKCICKCSACNEIFCKDFLQKCFYCNNYICKKCIPFKLDYKIVHNSNSICSKCDKCICNSCSLHCHNCNRNHCKKCAKYCYIRKSAYFENYRKKYKREKIKYLDYSNKKPDNVGIVFLYQFIQSSFNIISVNISSNEYIDRGSYEQFLDCISFHPTIIKFYACNLHIPILEMIECFEKRIEKLIFLKKYYISGKKAIRDYTKVLSEIEIAKYFNFAFIINDTNKKRLPQSFWSSECSFLFTKKLKMD